MDHRTRVTADKDATLLRYRLTPGSTAQYEVRLDLHMEIRMQADADPDLLDAQITTDLDFEVVRPADGDAAVVRVHGRNTSMWVTSESTLDEDDVSEPLSGLPVAILLDDRGNSVPLADTMGRDVAPTDDTNAAPFVLKAMLPLYSKHPVAPGDEWQVRNEHGTTGHVDPGETSCVYVSVDQSDGWLEPVIRHRYAYQWSLADGERGATAYAADTRVSTRDGWPRQVTGEVEIDRHFGRTTVRIHADRRS